MLFITLKHDFDFADLKEVLWDKAYHLACYAEDVGKEDEFMRLIDNEFGDSVPTVYEVNEFLCKFDKNPLI